MPTHTHKCLSIAGEKSGCVGLIRDKRRLLQVGCYSQTFFAIHLM